MKVFFFISSLRCGGAERVASILIRRWTHMGHEITLFTSTNADSDYFEVPMHVCRVQLGLDFPAATLLERVRRNVVRIWRLRKAIQASSPDVVVSFMDGNNVIALLSSIGLHVPIVVSERSDPTRDEIPWPWRALRWCLYGRASTLVVQNNSQMRWAARLFPKLRTVVVANPIEIHSASNSDKAENEIVLHPATKKFRTIIAVGRLAPEKQYDKLIHCFEEIASNHEGWTLEIVGAGSEYSRLRSIAEDSPYRNRILIHGTSMDPIPRLRGAEIFVLCSRFEGFPNAVIEAMICSVVPIGFNSSGSLEGIVIDGKNGQTIAPEDWKGLTKSLSALIDDNEGRAAMADCARKTVLEKFTATKIASQWIETLAQAASKKR